MKIYKCRGAFTQRGAYDSWHLELRFSYNAIRQDYNIRPICPWNPVYMIDDELFEKTLKYTTYRKQYDRPITSMEFYKIRFHKSRKISLASFWYMAKIYNLE